MIPVHRGAAFAWAMLHFATAICFCIATAVSFGDIEAFWSLDTVKTAFNFSIAVWQFSRMSQMKVASLQGWEKPA